MALGPARGTGARRGYRWSPRTAAVEARTGRERRGPVAAGSTGVPATRPTWTTHSSRGRLRCPVAREWACWRSCRLRGHPGGREVGRGPTAVQCAAGAGAGPAPAARPAAGHRSPRTGPGPQALPLPHTRVPPPLTPVTHRHPQAHTAPSANMRATSSRAIRVCSNHCRAASACTSASRSISSQDSSSSRARASRTSSNAITDGTRTSTNQTNPPLAAHSQPHRHHDHPKAPGHRATNRFTTTL
ncbi:hypothetical protein ABH941_007299 [Streptacidiphilus sp. EB103A]